MHVIAYASRTMDPAQQNYTTTEKELLAIVFALDTCRSYLLVESFVLIQIESEPPLSETDSVQDWLCPRPALFESTSNPVRVHSNSSSSPMSLSETKSMSSQFEIELKPMENNDQTLKELATPDMVYQPWCIQYPQLKPTQSYGLKSDLIHLLSKFHSFVGKDPHKHLKEFHMGLFHDEATRDTGILH
ncbi:hypothetical protein CR513_06636, partial [Mucuna pruriens]